MDNATKTIVVRAMEALVDWMRAQPTDASVAMEFEFKGKKYRMDLKEVSDQLTKGAQDGHES